MVMTEPGVKAGPSFQVNVLFLNTGPKGNVLAHGHVLEERKALEHETHATLLHGQRYHVLICTIMTELQIRPAWR